MIGTTQISVISSVIALAAGLWIGYDYRDAKAERERSQELRETASQLERAMERRAAAEEALNKVRNAVSIALRKKADEKPIECPKSGNVLDAVVPGIGDELRNIDASQNHAPEMDSVPGATNP